MSTKVKLKVLAAFMRMPFLALQLTWTMQGTMAWGNLSNGRVPREWENMDLTRISVVIEGLSVGKEVPPCSAECERVGELLQNDVFRIRRTPLALHSNTTFRSKDVGQAAQSCRVVIRWEVWDQNAGTMLPDIGFPRTLLHLVVRRMVGGFLKDFEPADQQAVKASFTVPFTVQDGERRMERSVDVSIILVVDRLEFPSFGPYIKSVDRIGSGAARDGLFGASMSSKATINASSRASTSSVPKTNVETGHTTTRFNTFDELVQSQANLQKLQESSGVHH